MCIYHNLFTHASVRKHINCFHLYAAENNAAMYYVYKYLFKSLLSLLLGMYMELFKVSRVAMSFATVATSFYTFPPAMNKVSNFPITLSALVIFHFVIFVFL